LALITYSADSCIRNAYYYNQCSNCVTTCQENVFSVVQNRIKFDANLCTYCSACLGVCPTEAIKMDIFEPNRFSLEFKFSKEDKLDCKDKTRCLSSFDSQHFSVMLLERENLVCDLSQCSECDIGSLKGIEAKIDEANNLLDKVSENKKIEKVLEIEEKETLGKRELFGKIFEKATEKVSIPDSENARIERLLNRNGLKKMLPTKHKILIEALKDFEFETIKPQAPLINSQNISDKCTNCKDCIQFCPTEALFHSTDMLSIYINSAKCISCGICQDICKVDAVSDVESINIIDFMRPRKLVSFSMSVCGECKTPYIQRGDETICSRCFDFVENFSSMLSLARDL